MINSLVEQLARRAADHPDRLLYAFLDGAGREVERYSYRDFDERTNHLAQRLADSGRVAHGQPVLLVYPPGLEFIVAFFACAKLGAIPVPVPPPDAVGLVSALEKLSHVAGDCGAVTALTTAAFGDQLQLLAGRSEDAQRWLAAAPLSGVAWLPTDREAGRLAAFAARPHDLLFLQYTSGSTQRPRGVMVTHANVIANCEATLHHAAICVSWLPHYHDMGLIGYALFVMLRGGSTHQFSGASFLKRPLLWLETISRVRATMSSAPNFAFEYCLREDKVPDDKLAGIDLSSLHCLMNAAEPARASTMERFNARFRRCGLPARALAVFYGLAENTLAVSGDGRIPLTVNARLLEQNQLRVEPPRADGYNQSRLMSCGAPLPGQDVRIVDPATGRALGEDRIGEVWVAGASKADGYHGKPELSREMLQARLADAPDGPGHLRTGDMGFLHDGELFVCGRLKDMIIVAGRNHYPNDIESVVEQASSKVRPGCVAAFAIDGAEGEAIAVVVEAVRGNDMPDLEAIGAAVRKRCQVEIDLLAVVAHGAIAKTSSGKVARQETRRRWLAGEASVLAQRARAPVASDAFLDDLLNRFDIAGYEDKTLADLGVDSLTLVELTMRLEAVLKGHGARIDRSLLDAVSDLRILQAVTVGELRGLLRQVDADARIPTLAPRRYARRLRALEKDETRQMRHDAVLPSDIAPGPARPADGGALLLTGATGFLGAFMLEAMLRLTDRPIVTVVRAEDAGHAALRTESALRRTGLMTEPLRAALAARVTAVPGDLARPRLGLADAAWARLADTVGAIYHCGADVDYVKPYGALRDANVTGTVEMLRLASQGAAKAFHLASSTFIFGFEARETCWEHEANAEMAELNFGYAQSKWVSEQLAFAASARGLPVKIYRPSLITASRLARYAQRDLMARTLGYLIRHRISTTAANQISYLPVDVCANNMVALSLDTAPRPTTFHLTADRYYTMRTVCELITERFGYTFDYMPLDRVVDHINTHCTRDDALYPLKAFLNHNHPRIDRMAHKRYDSADYRTARGQSPLCQPEPPLDETVAAIVTFLQRETLVPPAPERAVPPAPQPAQSETATETPSASWSERRLRAVVSS